MAHDITFKNNTYQAGEPIFFFGYYEGLFYEYFNAQRFNAGVSGNGGIIRRSRDEVISTLKKISETEVARNYPDKGRLPRLLKEIEESNAEEFEIQFS